MQPVSIVEKEGFKELIEYLEPSFVMPTRFKIKETSLPMMKQLVEEKQREELKEIESVTILLDGWSTLNEQCFNGFRYQGKYIY